jgi:hypothetical protein
MLTVVKRMEEKDANDYSIIFWFLVEIPVVNFPSPFSKHA